jgi:hypothetical protein
MCANVLESIMLLNFDKSSESQEFCDYKITWFKFKFRTFLLNLSLYNIVYTDYNYNILYIVYSDYNYYILIIV